MTERTPAIDVARDLAYVAIGFGVLGFQQAQVRRRELQRLLEPIVNGALSAIPCSRQAK